MCWQANLVFGLAAASFAGAALAHEATPIGKVVELLDVLSRQLKENGRADGLAHVQYMAWYSNESSTAKRIASETSATIASLGTGMEELQALRDQDSLRLQKVIGELALNEQDLKDATASRNKQRAAFEADEAALVNAVDQLERSLDVLGGPPPSAGAGMGSDDGSGGDANTAPRASSLAAVAKKLRTALVQGKDIHMTTAQHETLDSFLHEATTMDILGAESARRQLSSAGVLAPDFLQVRSKGSGPYGEYASRGSGVSAVLQSVLETSEKKLEETRLAEENAMKNFRNLQRSLKREIENKENTISETRTQISLKQENLSKMQSRLLAARELLKATQDSLQKVEVQFQSKVEAYKSRVAKRSDELMAVREAVQLLTSAVAQRLLSDGGGRLPPSMLQVTQDVRRKARHLLRSAATPGIALLSIKAHTHSAHQARADPFGKVKAMVRDMLQKLQAEQAQETQHKAWCDAELGKSTASQRSKQEMIQKLSDRIGAMDAEISQLVDDITTVNRDLADMRKATESAAAIRQQERANALASIQQFKDAQDLLHTALSVLRKFYDSKASEANSPPRGAGDEYKSNDGMGTGVIGILEICLQDYVDLQQQSEESEAAAEQEFKDLMNDNEVRAAVFEKDLEYKSRGKVRLEYDRMRANTDMKNYGKELEAVESYLDKLKGACAPKGDTYEERKARREEEIKSLQEALQYLTAGVAA